MPAISDHHRGQSAETCLACRTEQAMGAVAVAGPELEEAKDDATPLALKLQEDCGIDVVTDGEQSRRHFVHGLLEFVEGIDFARKVEIGIRADRYMAMVPTVTSELRLKGRVHAREARLARAHTKRDSSLPCRDQ